MIVAGFHPVAAALAERPEAVEALLLQEGRRDARARELERTAREKGIPVRHVPREELDRTAGKAHNGVAARVATREYDPVEEALGGEPGSRLVLFLDEVTDPGNLGSILRTAAAAGASVVLPERHSVGLNESRLEGERRGARAGEGRSGRERGALPRGRQERPLLGLWRLAGRGDRSGTST